MDGAQVVDDAAAADDDDAAIAKRGECSADRHQLVRRGRIRLRDLDDWHACVREGDAERDPEAVIPAALFFERGVAEERGDLAGEGGIAGSLVSDAEERIGKAAEVVDRLGMGHGVHAHLAGLPVRGDDGDGARARECGAVRADRAREIVGFQRDRWRAVRDEKSGHRRGHAAIIRPMRIRCVLLVFPVAVASRAAEPQRLPTGAMLDPVAAAHGVGNFPLAMAVAPGGERVALLLCGWREQGVQIVDRKSGAVMQTLPQAAAFIGLAFAPDGKTLYASGGNDDSIFVYRWNGREATADGKIELADKPKPKPESKERAKAYSGTQYPAGIAVSQDGRFLYVAENLADSIAVIDLAQRKVIQLLRTDRYPYAVVTDRHGNIYVSAWGDNTVNVFRADHDGLLRFGARIVAGRHPSAMVLRGSRLYVASASTDSISVIDTTNARSSTR